MNKLNSPQREAVRHASGPLLVLAGAGSGKTRVIIEKISHLIKSGAYAPEQIAAITFTNKAAKEMLARLPKKRKNETPPWISTFHTLGLRILRRNARELGYKSGFSIIDSRDSEAILADLLRKESAQEQDIVRTVQYKISNWKSELILPNRKSAAPDTDPHTTLAWACYPEYCETLSAYNCVDFDDLIVRPIELLRKNPDILARWHEEIQYLLIDEYQDTNSAQYELVKILVGAQERFTVVGDDDQSIYAWRGAKPENLMRLQADFPALKVVKLEQNYRSMGTILKAANTLIANNPHIFPKKLWSEHGSGDALKVYRAKSEHDEVEYVSNQILHQRMVRGNRYGDYAILFRSNHQARLFEAALRERNIPYVLSGGKSFFDYGEIKDLVCYLRAVANPSDDNAILRIINTPRRGIGASTIKDLVAAAGARSLSLVEAAEDAECMASLSQRAANNLGDFFSWLAAVHQRTETDSPLYLAKQIIADISYRDWVEKIADSEGDMARKHDNLDELLSWLERIEHKTPDAHLSDAIASLTLFDILDRQDDDAESDSVALMTLHAAKGLEFPHVYIVGFEENILPHRSSIEDETIEEERRLAYVGITRAQKTLTLSFASQRQRYGETVDCDPSRFLDELPSDDLHWEGQAVEHVRDEQKAAETLSSLREMLQS
ncbi:MAG: UvrD-helicase domain-containing protein [Gammaproteobacteria bacterium]